MSGRLPAAAAPAAALRRPHPTDCSYALLTPAAAFDRAAFLDELTAALRACGLARRGTRTCTAVRSAVEALACNANSQVAQRPNGGGAEAAAGAPPFAAAAVHSLVLLTDGWADDEAGGFAAAAALLRQPPFQAGGFKALLVSLRGRSQSGSSVSSVSRAQCPWLCDLRFPRSCGLCTALAWLACQQHAGLNGPHAHKPSPLAPCRPPQLHIASREKSAGCLRRLAADAFGENLPYVQVVPLQLPAALDLSAASPPADGGRSGTAAVGTGGDERQPAELHRATGWRGSGEEQQPPALHRATRWCSSHEDDGGWGSVRAMTSSLVDFASSRTTSRPL